MNGSPGAIGGAFISNAIDVQNIHKPRGWWGHKIATRQDFTYFPYLSSNQLLCELLKDSKWTISGTAAAELANFDCVIHHQFLQLHYMHHYKVLFFSVQSRTHWMIF